MGIQIFKPEETGIVPAIQAALVSPLANQSEDNILKSYILLGLRSAHRITGFKVPEMLDLNLTADKVVKEMRRNKTNIRLAEIDIAISNGCHGAYGEYMGLSPKSINDFIKGYVVDQNRLAAIKLKEAPKSNNPPSNDEILALSKKNALFHLEVC